MNSSFGLLRYYTHYLYLPKINAVSEGVWGLALICIISGLIGPEFWVSSSLGFELNKIILVGFIAGAPVMAYNHYKKILTKVPDKKDILLKCRFTLLFISLTILTHLFNPSFYEYSYMIIMTLNVSKLTILCMLAHSTSRDFQPIRFTNLGIAIIYFLLLFLTVFRAEVSSIKYVLLAVSFADFSVFVYTIVKRIADLLDIKVFSVTPRGVNPLDKAK